MPGTVSENVRNRRKQKDDKIAVQLQTSTTGKLSLDKTWNTSQIKDLVGSNDQATVENENNLLETNTSLRSRNLMADSSEISKAEFGSIMNSNKNLDDQSAFQKILHQTDNEKIEPSGSLGVVRQPTKAKKRARRKK